jgi:hypothetical protein
VKLTKEEARDVVWEDHEDWETIEEDICSNSRWAIHMRGIFKHVPSGKFYELHWDKGATEYQEQQPFEYTDPDLIEVHQVEKVVKVWETVPEVREDICNA